jgi:hypothetical protein
MSEQEVANIVLKFDADKLAKTKLGTIRRLTRDAGIDAIYEFLVPIVEGGEAALDGIEIGQLKQVTEQLRAEIEKLGNQGN